MAELANPAVHSSTIKDLYLWIEGGATFQEAISRLRLKCVPPGYTTTPWTKGTDTHACIHSYIELQSIYTLYSKIPSSHVYA